MSSSPRFAIVGAVIGTMIVSGTAFAQQTRYKRNVDIKVDVKQTEKTKKLEPKKQSKKVVPELTADDFIELQGKVGHIQKQVIQNLKLLIADTPKDHAELPDLLFRLGELYGQQARYWRFRGMEMEAKIAKAPKNQKAKLRSSQKRYFNESKKMLLEGVKAYQQVVVNDNFKDYPRRDEVIFYLGYTLQNADKKYMKQARAAYQKLIQEHPNSRFVPNAYLVFGDYFFAQNSLANAEQFYDKVLQFPKSDVYPYALYKKGWVYLNLDRPQDALETFYDVVQKTKNDKKNSILNQASKKDFVRAYAEVGRPQLAYKSFQRVDKGYAFEMLQILGDLYIEKGMTDKTIYTMRELISLEPRHKMVCDWQFNVVQATMGLPGYQNKVDEIENLVKLYTAYKDKNILPESNLGECRDNAEGVTSEMAKLWHNEAMKTLDQETLAYVDRLYKLFLDNFPESEEAGEMQYYYAELLWSRADGEKNQRLATELWENAAVAFTNVVKSGKLQGKQQKESAYAAVLAWKNALDVDPRTKAPPTPEDDEKPAEKVPEPQDIPEREQKMIEAFDIYIEYIKDPKDEELVMMKFLKARLFWRYNHLDKAVPLFGDIIENHMDHESAEYSANLLLDSLNRLQRYDEMIKWVDILIAKKAFLEDKEDLAERLETLKRQSLRKNAEQIEAKAKESGDLARYVECGQAYLEIYNRDPGGAKSDEVLYNAGVCFEEGKSVGTAIQMYETLAKKYPDSEQAQKSIARLGNAYAQIAWYDRAAERLEAYAKKYGGEDDAYKALSNAVFYRKGIGDDAEAIKDTEYFVKQYGKKKDLRDEAADAMFSMTSIYEKQGDRNKVVSHLERYLKEFGRYGGPDKQIIAQVKIGEILWEMSCPVKSVNGACIKVKRERATVSKGRRKASSLPTQCGPESKIKITVLKRDVRKARDARRAFQRAISLYEKANWSELQGDTDAEKEAARYMATQYYAAAKFYMAEEGYERFLDMTFPTGLDFDPKNKKKAERSGKVFQDWLAKKQKVGDDVNKAYKEVIAVTGGGAHWAIAAAARVGQVAQSFSDTLFTAEIPRNVRTGQFADEAVDAYCDALTTAAAPLEESSIGAFSTCLEESTKRNWFNEWSQLCEKELGQIRPQDFPSTAEMYSSPDNVAAVLDTQGPVLELTSAN